MATAAPTANSKLGFLTGIRQRDLILPMGIVSIIGLMIIPLPTLFLDLLLAVNITLAIVVFRADLLPPRGGAPLRAPVEL